MNALYDKGVKQSDRIAGVVAIVVYLLSLAMFIIFTSFTVDDKFVKEVQSSGILMSFGNQTRGDGAKVTDKSQATRTKPKVNPKINNTPKQSVKATATKSVVNDNSTKAVVAAAVKKQTVNKGALYKNRNSSNKTTTSQDVSSGISKGRDGKSGSKSGALDVAGGGGEGDNFSLAGRSLIGALEPPIYDDRISGRIVIEIQVNRDGEVIAATFNPKNSTISSRSIIEAVRKVAMKAQFNADPLAAFTQVGTITYILKVE